MNTTKRTTTGEATPSTKANTQAEPNKAKQNETQNSKDGSPRANWNPPPSKQRVTATGHRHKNRIRLHITSNAQHHGGVTTQKPKNGRDESKVRADKNVRQFS